MMTVFATVMNSCVASIPGNIPSAQTKSPYTNPLASLLPPGIDLCNTVKGVGQDLQKAGEKIENSVKK